VLQRLRACLAWGAYIASGAGVVTLLLESTAARADPMSTSPEQAYDLGEIPNARAVAMGGALDALGVSTTGLFLNPANMALARVYHIEAIGAFSPESQRQTYGGAIVDSVLNTSRLAGGLGGTWSVTDPSGIHRTWADVRAGLALPLGDHLALGAVVRWLHVEQNVAAGPFGPSLASDGTPSGPIFNSLTADVGITVSIVEGLRVALSGDNITNPGTALAPTVGRAGIGYSDSVFALEVDGLLDFTTWGSVRGRVMAGGELFLAERYALRAGWRYDAGEELNAASIGFGYIDPQWSVEIGLRRDLVADHGQTFGVIGLRYFYDALGLGSPADDTGTSPF
jgi:hypothetical protein